MVRKVATSLATFELADETAPRRSCSSAARDHERLPVALLHGFTGNKQSFATLRSGLRARGFRVLAFDLPFHGGTVVTAPVAALSVEGCAEALDALGVQRFCLMGYSMGGRIALALALNHPDRVARLVLESASAGIADERERDERRRADEELARFAEENGIEPFVARWEAMALFASLGAMPERRKQALRRIRLSCRAPELARCLRTLGTGSQPYLGDRLHTLSAETLLIAGRLDAKYCAAARAMNRAIARSRLAIIDGAGHVPHLERPRVVLRLVAAFLAGKEPLQEIKSTQGEEMRCR